MGPPADHMGPPADHMGPPADRSQHPRYVYSYGFSNIDLVAAVGILPALRGVELVGGLTLDQQRDLKEV